MPSKSGNTPLIYCTPIGVTFSTQTLACTPKRGYNRIYVTPLRGTGYRERTLMRTNIASERVKLGLSQEQLGKSIGVSRDVIKSWESEKTTPKLDMAFKLCDLFGCTLDYLYARTEERLPQANPKNLVGVIHLYTDGDCGDQTTIRLAVP